MTQTVWWQYCLPQHLLTQLLGKLANCRCTKIKNMAIRAFSRHFNVDLNEAIIENYTQYETFNAFFTRHLKPQARPIASDQAAVISPVDGSVSQIGKLHDENILQAKGKSFSLTSLLGDERLAQQYKDGDFLTSYLSPRDYHRIHFPVDAELKSMRYIPGKLFSVNEISVAKIDRLFARNERVVCEFDSCVLVLVGAMVVGSIVTDWHGIVNRSIIHYWQYEPGQHHFERGEELGYFQLGSTVIVLFPSNQVEWHSTIKTGDSLRMGQSIGRKNEKSDFINGVSHDSKSGICKTSDC